MSGGHDPYLMPHERRVLTVRQHPLVTLGKPAGLLLAALAAASWTDVATQVAWWLPWLMVLVAAWNLGRHLGSWMLTYIIVTNLRIIVVTGFLLRKTSMMPLVKVVDMSMEKPILGEVFGYGRLIIEAAGEHHPLRRLESIPDVESVYARICSMLFTAPDEREEEPPR